MKIVQINATCGRGSTGKICVGISRLLTEQGVENYILYTSGRSDYPLGISCADDRYIRRQALKSRVYGNWGFNSRRATRRMIAELERIRPDIVHLHNLHGHGCDLDMLFSYFKAHNTKLIWTFHDCWSFTGYCTYFDLVACDKWRTGCDGCPQKRAHTWFLDRSHTLYERKKALFAGLDLTIVTPSQWLAELVGDSFLGNYPTKVIHNGIDLSVFHPTESNFREENGLTDKYIVLGVAFDWGVRKGLDVFTRLADRLDDRYRIVLVGTDDAVDRTLPANILSIHRTQNQQELAAIYSAADVFANPTREENYPTVNMESIACGTPVVTFRTGGSPEILGDVGGIAVDKNDIAAMQAALRYICEDRPIDRSTLTSAAQAFDQSLRNREYLALYGISPLNHI